eukprot:scaffold21977_cov107-Isochrysis_galbana.AAC.1
MPRPRSCFAPLPLRAFLAFLPHVPTRLAVEAPPQPHQPTSSCARLTPLALRPLRERAASRRSLCKEAPLSAPHLHTCRRRRASPAGGCGTASPPVRRKAEPGPERAYTLSVSDASQPHAYTLTTLSAT